MTPQEAKVGIEVRVINVSCWDGRRGKIIEEEPTCPKIVKVRILDPPGTWYPGDFKFSPENLERIREEPNRKNQRLLRRSGRLYTTQIHAENQR